MLRNSVLRTRYRLRSPNSQLSVAGRYESYSTTRGSRRAQEQVSQVPPLLRAGPSSRNDTTRLSTWRDQILLFHATPRREGLQFFPLLAAALKVHSMQIGKLTHERLRSLIRRHPHRWNMYDGRLG